MRALGCRTTAEAMERVAALELRLGSAHLTLADVRVLAQLPPGPLMALGHAPDAFVRFVANVYALG